MRDKQFIRRYKAWLTQFNDLKDCAFEEPDGEWKQFTDIELEIFRNNPKDGYAEKWIAGMRWPLKVYKNDYIPTYEDFGCHFAKEFGLTIYAMNRSSSRDPIIMLGDIDNKDGKGDVDRAVDTLIHKYRFDSCYVEPSTHFNGRHLYFLIDPSIQGAEIYDRDDIWQTFDKLTGLIQKDPIWGECGVGFDGFYGCPTLWDKDETGHIVTKRGNALKLPRVLSGESDLAKLETLIPQSFERLKDLLRGNVTPKTDSGGIPVSASKGQPCLASMTGGTKHAACCGQMLRSDINVTIEEVYAEYMKNWEPSIQSNLQRDHDRRLKKLSGCLERMRKKTRPKDDPRKYPFKRDQFLPQVQSLKIPSEEFQWNRREILNEQRLADFISIKVADAFYNKGHFARTKRDTTINNCRALKEKGDIDWIVNSHSYRRLLDIAVKYDLLAVEEDFQMPLRDSRTHRKLADGYARLIGPGRALRDARNEWLPLFNEWKGAQNVWSTIKMKIA